jgi:hypothetical protein
LVSRRNAQTLPGFDSAAASTVWIPKIPSRAMTVSVAHRSAAKHCLIWNVSLAALRSCSLHNGAARCSHIAVLVHHPLNSLFLASAMIRQYPQVLAPHPYFIGVRGDEMCFYGSDISSLNFYSLAV